MTEEWGFEFALVGPGGEPIDLWRTIVSHGLASLPPMRVDAGTRTLELTVPVVGVGARTVRVGAGRAGYGVGVVVGAPPAGDEAERLRRMVGHVLRLDEDLAPFYVLAAGDPDLAWATTGAGRMARSATVFEDVVKTICTTNCTWSATVRMVGALVAHLGERAPGEAAGNAGRAFPTPSAMAAAGEEFYRDVVRAGYRGRYLRALAGSVAAGAIDLEELGRTGPAAPANDEVARRLLALPGVGPYAAAQVMMMLGRYSRLILDSWTRPTYARLTGGTVVVDREIVARFAPYGRYAGLAFWLFVTRDWVAAGTGGNDDAAG